MEFLFLQYAPDRTKLLETGSLEDRPRSGKPKTETVGDNKENVLTQVRDNPRTSIRSIEEETGVSRMSIWRVLEGREISSL